MRGLRCSLIMTVLLLGGGLAACNEPPEPRAIDRESKADGDGKNASKKGEPRDDSKDPKSNSPEDQSSASKSNPDEKDPDEKGGDSGTELTDATGQSGESFEYPTLKFKNAGYTTYRADSRDERRVPVVSSSATRIDAQQIELTTTGTFMNCKGVDGCEQKEVNEKARKLDGTDRHVRISEKEYQALKDKRGQINYAIFAIETVKKSGVRMTYSQPLPVYPWPAAASRYRVLGSGPARFTARVTSSEPLPNHEAVNLDEWDRNPIYRMDLSRNQQFVTNAFDVIVDVKLQNADGENVTLVIETTIPQDRKGYLYAAMPIPRRAVYQINSGDVVNVQAESWFHGTRSRDREKFVMTARLCERKTSKSTKTFPCG